MPEAFEVTVSPEPFVTLDPNQANRTRNRGIFKKVAAGAVGLGALALVSLALAQSAPGVHPTHAAQYWPWDDHTDCTADQSTSGCSTCYTNNTCTCAPGRKAAGAQCAPADGPVLMEFYMYRAQSTEQYEVDNNNAGTLAGVMWYIHNEVVRISCPRHYNITRLRRLKVQMHTTQEMYNPRHGQFGPFVAMDMGKCTVPNCDHIWNEYGYVVGCQKQADKHYGDRVYWYSLPGACPEMPFAEKTDECKKAHPGGKCPTNSTPTGAKDCTWNVEEAGEISLDDLEGISSYEDFCQQGHREFVVESDRGEGMSFWDGMLDDNRNAQRLQKARNLFASKYPDMPDLPEPICDW